MRKLFGIVPDGTNNNVNRPAVRADDPFARTPENGNDLRQPILPSNNNDNQRRSSVSTSSQSEQENTQIPQYNPARYVYNQNDKISKELPNVQIPQRSNRQITPIKKQTTFNQPSPTIVTIPQKPSKPVKSEVVKSLCLTFGQTSMMELRTIAQSMGFTDNSPEWKDKKQLCHKLSELLNFILTEQVSVDEFPQDMICPILHEIMYDPVVTNLGHSYSRSGLEKWKRTQSENKLPFIDPSTGLPITWYGENITLRKVILSWLLSHGAVYQQEKGKINPTIALLVPSMNGGFDDGIFYQPGFYESDKNVRYYMSEGQVSNEYLKRRWNTLVENARRYGDVSDYMNTILSALTNIEYTIPPTFSFKPDLQNSVWPSKIWNIGRGKFGFGIFEMSNEYHDGYSVIHVQYVPAVTNLSEAKRIMNTQYVRGPTSTPNFSDVRRGSMHKEIDPEGYTTWVADAPLVGRHENPVVVMAINHVRMCEFNSKPSDLANVATR